MNTPPKRIRVMFNAKNGSYVDPDFTAEEANSIYGLGKPHSEYTYVLEEQPLLKQVPKADSFLGILQKHTEMLEDQVYKGMNCLIHNALLMSGKRIWEIELVQEMKPTEVVWSVRLK